MKADWEQVFGWVAATAYIAACGLAVFGVDAAHGLLCNIGSNCIIDWVGALSGWMAAIVAAFTIRPLYRQLVTQTEQTDFTVGNAKPVIDAVQHLDKSSKIVVDIVNWNRRGILVRDVQLVGSGASLNIQQAEVDKEAVMPILGQLILPGWIDRAEKPHRMRMEVAAKGEDGNYLRDEWERTQIIVIYELFGARDLIKQPVTVNLTSQDLGVFG
jgi:hypothetical protein